MQIQFLNARSIHCIVLNPVLTFIQGYPDPFETLGLLVFKKPEIVKSDNLRYFLLLN